MKTKILTIITMILAFPTFIGLFFMGFVSFDYWLFEGRVLTSFLTGKCFYTALAIILTPSFFGMCAVLTYCIQMLKYGTKIDKLEEEARKCHVARLKYEAATKEFADKYLEKQS